ncbi:MAG TPA: NUDIX hydrolase [Gammaproteobacteria bacterium]|nr:NUDIX hydrolase [Gammaproteobacteria bacterium]
MSATLDLCRRLLAIAQTGLAFSDSAFDRERYEEVARIASLLLAAESQATPRTLLESWQVEGGYATPKIDVRGAVFRNDEVLLVRERSDGKWTLPGGWADVNERPSEAVEKEILQESGYRARAVKLAALYDRNLHGHPRYLYHAWKVFFVCELTGGEPRTSIETDAVGFFALDRLPELSTGRATAAQIQRMWTHAREPLRPADFD